MDGRSHGSGQHTSESFGQGHALGLLQGARPRQHEVTRLIDADQIPRPGRLGGGMLVAAHFLFPETILGMSSQTSARLVFAAGFGCRVPLGGSDAAPASHQ
jgi:hypothetical protein